jgi:hypothetical protein
MHSLESSRAGVARAVLVLSILVLILSACPSLPGQSILDQLMPEPEPTTKTVCQSSADLQAAIEDIRSTELSEEGLLPLVVKIDTAVSEARLLVELVGEELRPEVTDLVASLQGLRTTVESLDEQGTLGAGITLIGESLIHIGEAMDALALELQTRCP